MAIDPKDFQDLIRQISGPDVYNPYSGTVSYEQARAKDPGLTWETYKPKVDKFREYAGGRGKLIKTLQNLGYSLDNLGFQNKKEFGKHEFDMYGDGGFYSREGMLDPSFTYDWASGKKRNTTTSDVNSPWVPLDPKDLAAHQQAVEANAKGQTSYASQHGKAIQGMDLDMDQLKSLLASRGYDTGAEAISAKDLAKGTVKSGTSAQLDPLTGKIIKSAPSTGGGAEVTNGIVSQPARYGQPNPSNPYGGINPQQNNTVPGRSPGQYAPGSAPTMMSATTTPQNVGRQEQSRYEQKRKPLFAV